MSVRAWHEEARRLKASGWKQAAIAAQLGVSDSAVSYALSGKRGGPYDTEAWKAENLNRLVLARKVRKEKSQARQSSALALRAAGMRNKEIASHMGVAPQTVSVWFRLSRGAQ